MFDITEATVQAILNESRKITENVNVNQNTLIKDWYKEEYPDDELADEIRDNLTFYGLFETMDNYMDTYTVMNVGDSIVRERVFEKLADIMGVDYDYVYDQWLKCDKKVSDEDVDNFLKSMKSD